MVPKQIAQENVGFSFWNKQTVDFIQRSQNPQFLSKRDTTLDLSLKGKMPTHLF